MTSSFICCLIVSSLVFCVLAQEVLVSVEGGDFECVGEGCFGGQTGTIKVVNRDKEVIPPKHYRDVLKLGEVKRIDWKDPSEPFAQRAIARNKPIVFQSGTQVHRDWKALGKWNRDYLLKKLGPKSRMGGIYHSSIPTIYLYRDGADAKTYDQTYGQRPYEVVELTVRELFEKSLKPDVYGYYYYSQSVKHLGPAAKDLLADVSPIKILSPEPTKELSQKVQFWYGSKGVTTQMHYDLSYNFFVQVTGTKTFLLLPPENHKNIYMFPRIHPHHRRSQANLTAIDLEAFPKFADVTGALEVTLKAGDMLYLPPLWFHHVINNDAGFSVNVWTDYTLQEIYQGLFKKLLTINTELTFGLKLHTVRYLVSELLERTGFDPMDFMQVLYKQRYQPILEEPLSGDPTNPEMYCQINVELNLDKQNFESFLQQVVDHLKKIDGPAREIILGLRAVTPKLDGKSLESLFKKYNADIFCFQETKISSLDWVDDKLVHVPGYESFWSFSKKKKGYSGVATFVKKGLTLDAKNVFGEKRFDEEGRIIMTDHGTYMLFNVYFPNGGSGDDRRQYKHDFYDWFREMCKGFIAQGREVIVVGDVNTAHTELDTHRPDDTVNGYLPKERAWVTSFLESGFVDTYRHVHGDKRAYSWWDPKGTSRIDNKGWRIDFGFVTKNLAEQLTKAEYLPNQFGSDHCPFSMSLSSTITLGPHKPPALSSDIFKPKQAKISSFFVRKQPPPEEMEEEGSDEETGISVSQSQSQIGGEDNNTNNTNNTNSTNSSNNNNITGESSENPTNTNDNTREKIDAGDCNNNVSAMKLNETPTLLTVPTKAKAKHRPPSKKNPAEQLEKERNELIEQGVITEATSSEKNNDDNMLVEQKEEDTSKQVSVAPKKNLNFMAELNSKLAKPNLKRKASEAGLPNKESEDNSEQNNQDEIQNKNKRRKIAK